MKSLQGKGVPDAFIPTLREIYANKEALRFFNKRNNCSSASANDSRNDGLNSYQTQGYRGRGRGGNRGFRGNRGNAGKPAQQHRTSSLSDIVSSFEVVSLNGEVDQGTEHNSSDSDKGWSSDQRLWYRGRGRGGYRGNRGRRASTDDPRRIPSLQDDLGPFAGDWLNKDCKEINFPSGDALAAGDDSNTSSSGGTQGGNTNQPSAVRGRGRGGERGNGQWTPRNRPTNDNPAAAGGWVEPNRKQRGTKRFSYFSRENVL